MVAPSPYYAASPVRRTAPSLPFGWGTVTVVLLGAALLIIGILLILYGFLNFLTGTIGQAMSSSFSVTAFFQSFFGAIMLFVIGGVLAGVGGLRARRVERDECPRDRCHRNPSRGALLRESSRRGDAPRIHGPARGDADRGHPRGGEPQADPVRSPNRSSVCAVRDDPGP